MTRLPVALLALVLACPAAGQEYVTVRGNLADEDFYRVVACAAEPGALCRKPFLRWPADRRQDLTVAFVPAPRLRVPYASHRFEAGLGAALAEINALDAGIRLRRTQDSPDIAIYLVPTLPGGVMRNIGVPDLDNVRLPLARVSIRTRQGAIRKANIAVSVHARPTEIGSLLLEEIVQALGLITDIRGAAYRGSVFSEDGNRMARLEGQDAMALRRHYAMPDSFLGLVKNSGRAASGDEAGPSPAGPALRSATLTGRR